MLELVSPSPLSPPAGWREEWCCLAWECPLPSAGSRPSSAWQGWVSSPPPPLLPAHSLVTWGQWEPWSSPGSHNYCLQLLWGSWSLHHWLIGDLNRLPLIRIENKLFYLISISLSWIYFSRTFSPQTKPSVVSPFLLLLPLKPGWFHSSRSIVCLLISPLCSELFTFWL